MGMANGRLDDATLSALQLDPSQFPQANMANQTMKPGTSTAPTPPGKTP
jgi:hypothetical protein